MTQMYLFILAFLLPSGEMQIKHTIVPNCPTQEQVMSVMKPMKDAGDIMAWGGHCSPLIPDRKA